MDKMMKKNKRLIAFFSRKGNNYTGGGIVNLPVGNTEVAAKELQEMTGGDLFRIDTVREYPADYIEATDVAKQELRQDARPKLTDLVDKIEDYGVIFLGYPNWWGTMPMAVFTFLEAYDFSGKTIVPFCTHEGSGLGRSESDIKKLCPKANVLRGLAIRGERVQEAEETISAWLQQLGMVTT
jgi:flavodoxin